MSRFWLAAGIMLAFGLAYAQTPAPQETPAPAESAPAQAPAPAAEPPPAPTPDPAPAAKKLDAKQVPSLSIRWDCGACTLNDKVPPLVEAAYAAAAAAEGYAVSGSETAEMRITEFNQRPPGARAMFGVFAGRDVLTTSIGFRGKTFAAADYSANAWVGMNGVSEAVGKEAFKQMLAAVQAKQ
jgi:hypothetical protein